MGNGYSEKVLMNASFGYACHRIILDDYGTPVDYEFLEINKTFENIIGLKAEKVISKTYREIFSTFTNNDIERLAFYADIATNGGTKEIHQYFPQQKRWYRINITSPEKHIFSALYSEIQIPGESTKDTIPYMPLEDKLRKRKILLKEQNEEYKAINEEVRVVNSELQASSVKLKDNYSHLNALLKAIPDHIFVFNHKGDYLDCHTANTDNLMLAPEKLLRKNIKEVLPWDAASITLHHIDELFTTGKQQHFRYGLTVQNQDLFFDLRMVRYGDDKAIAVARDITHYKIYERKNDELISLLDRGYDFIGVADLNQKVSYLNPAGMRMVGLKEEEVKDTRIEDYFMPEDLPFVHNTILPALEKKGRWAGELRFRHFKTGKPIPVLYELYKTVDPTTGKTTNISTISRDISDLKEAERLLQESENTFRALFEKGPIGVAYHKMVYDHSGKAINYLFLDANRSYQKLTGVNPKGKLVTEAFPGIEKDPFNWIGTFEQVARYGKEVRFQQCLQPNNRWYDCVGYQYKPDHFVAAFLEITEQKITQQALHESEEKYRLIFEKSPLGVFHFDKNGIVTDCNDKLVQIIQTTKEKIIGVNINALPDPRITKASQEVLEGKSTTFEGLYTTLTSQISIPVRVFFSPIPGTNSQITGGIGLVEDRTSHFQKDAFEKQVAIAKESIRFKQNFLANMSHEIRTPLTGIIGMMEILENTTLTDKQKEYINILKNSSENLRIIINQVLDFSKIEAGKVQLQTRAFLFKNLINDARKLFTSLCSNKEVTFHSILDPKIPVCIIADYNRLSQIINNLISNAVKFTSRGSITIKAELLQQLTNIQHLLIKIEVADTGIGIDAEMQEKLFTPFSQIEDGDTRNYEGSGLGLSICKELASLMQGETGVESSKGNGSKFWFTFLAKETEAGSQSAQTSKPADLNKGKKLKILVAEDKIINQKVISLMLKQLGHKVVFASNGEEALKMYKHGLFDVILMDIQMPVMNGIEATKKLREKYTDLPPVVGLSANAFEGDREKYMQLGMDEYLTKPFRIIDFEKITQIFF